MKILPRRPSTSCLSSTRSWTEALDVRRSPKKFCLNPLRWSNATMLRPAKPRLRRQVRTIKQLTLNPKAIASDGAAAAADVEGPAVATNKEQRAKRAQMTSVRGSPDEETASHRTRVVTVAEDVAEVGEAGAAQGKTAAARTRLRAQSEPSSARR